MYTRITKTGDRQYLQLVESFRNDRGQVRVRVVANLGRLDKLTAENLDPLINGLNRAIGRAGNPASEVIHESARAHGNVFALHERIQKHTAHIGDRTFKGASKTTPEQHDLFDALSLSKPA